MPPTILREARITYGPGPRPDLGPVMSSRDVYRLLTGLFPDEPQERFVCLALSARNRVEAWTTIGLGPQTHLVVDVAAIFRFALLSCAVSIILAHRHPSGDPSPSPEDIASTRRICEGGELLGIRVLDHVIVGDGRHCSLLDQNLMPQPKEGA